MKITTTSRLLSLSSVLGSLETFLLPKAFTAASPSSFFASAMAPKAPSSSSPLKVRVATYNVLSSHLSEPDYYTTLNPDHLDPGNRLPVVLQHLDAEMSRKSILCLQEISHDWAGVLHAHCCNRGYHLVTGLYGKKFNGYMGVAVAFPTSSYEVLGVDVSRLSDQREGGWPRPPKEPKRGALAKLGGDLFKWGKTTAKSLLGILGILDAPKWPPQDAWTMAENRFNQLVTVRLRDTATQKSFAVGNYHMPCAFYKPAVMTIHTDLAARHVQKLTAGNNDGNDGEPTPYVLAGDWNIKPDGSSYRLLTTGKMDKGDPEWPEPKHGMEWHPTCRPMRSAYAVANGREPDFTNYARIREEDPFVDTLDYVFLSEEWTVTGVKELVSREESGGPFPNLDVGQPSDHVLIAADLEL